MAGLSLCHAASRLFYVDRAGGSQARAATCEAPEAVPQLPARILHVGQGHAGQECGCLVP